MYKKTLLSALVAAAMTGAAVSYVYAEDATGSQEQEVVEQDVDQGVEQEVTDTDGARKFDDPQRLEDTLIGWQEEKVTQAEEDLKDAEDALANAPDDATEDELKALQEAVDDAQAEKDEAVANLDEEKEKLPEQISELSEEQLFALNRSLNNATNNGLIVDLNSEYMQELLDGDYNKQQINSLTKALEEEAKFDKLSDKFTDKYELTGNEKFLDKADMMTSKGEWKKDKFLAKIDKFDRSDVEVEQQDKAKKTARNNAKSTVRDVSKNSARKEAKRAAKNEAKKIAKEKSRENARNKQKSNNGKKKT